MMVANDEDVTSATPQATTVKSAKTDILDIMGGDGPWQRRIFFVLLFISIPSAGHNLSITFLAPDQDYWCARTPEAVNLSVQEWKSIGLPPDDKHCSRYENVHLAILEGNSTNTTNKIVPCDFWEYDNSFYTSTILRKWNLVCGRDWLISLTKSIFMLGILVSVVLIGNLSDRFGRQPTITACCALTIVSAFVCAIASSFAVYNTFRFFVAMGFGGYFNTLYVLLMEVVNSDMRTVYGSLVQMGFSTGFVLLPGVAWLIRDAFWIQIAITAPSVVFLGVWWMVPESPRWLLSRGRIEEAKRTLTEAARINGLNLPEILLEKVIEEAKEGRPMAEHAGQRETARSEDVAGSNRADCRACCSKFWVVFFECNDFDSGETKGNFWGLIRTPGLWQMCLYSFYSWLVVSFIYYGLSFNTNELAGDPFVNFALSGVIEYPGYLLSMLAIKYLGRRRPCGSVLIMEAFLFLLSYFIPQNLPWLSVTIAMVGKLCVTGLYGAIYVFTSELLPTVVRNEGMGWASIFEQIGSMLAPFVHELRVYAGSFAPFCIYGFLALSSGVLIFFLPETKDLAVPDTLSEASRRDQTNASSKTNYGSATSVSTERTNA